MRTRPVTRIAADDAGQGLGQLVLALLDIIRQLIERRAIRRVESGRLGPDEVEQLGQALIALEAKFAELREVFKGDTAGAPPVESIDVEEFLGTPDQGKD